MLRQRFGCHPAGQRQLHACARLPPIRWCSEAPLAPSTCRGPGTSRLPWRVTAGVLVTRLILLPALMTGLVLLALRLGAFKPLDPMFLLVILLSNATPTAINLQVYCWVLGGLCESQAQPAPGLSERPCLLQTLCVLYKHGEAEMSQLLFWQYLAAMVTIPAYLAWFLRIIDAWT